ncbi:MAG: hypothetical protein IPO92_19705 [Saprospiraceae bacterium]|nr:hypothetical protein [Saprospiraceae bacterium]
MGFIPSSSILVDSLGAFDSGADGFATGTTIEVGIIDSLTGITIGIPLAFTSASPGVLKGHFRMKALTTPINLAAGRKYFILAVGFNTSDQNGNATFPPNLATNLNNGSGLITFGTNRYGSQLTFGWPLDNLDGGPTGRYHAGTFTFKSVQPVLKTTINSAQITSNNNGVNDTIRISVCDKLLDNLKMDSFVITSLVSPQVKSNR